MEDFQRASTQRTEGLEIFDGHKLGCSGVSRGKKRCLGERGGLDRRLRKGDDLG